MGQKWPDCGKDVADFILDVARELKNILGSNLVAIYLHGSLVTGSFYPPKSDIDLLILIHEKLRPEEQKSIHKALLNLNARRPITGSLELSMVLRETAKNPVHPIAYELHYGENYDEAIAQGTFDYDAINKNDPDLAAHFTVTKAYGIALYGPPAQEMLGDTPWKNFMDAVLADLKWILEDKNILTSPFYSVLNACRILQLLKGGKRTLASKEEGALWGLTHLPPEQYPIIQKALACYRSDRPVTPSERRTGGETWDEEALLEFRNYVRSVTELS